MEDESQLAKALLFSRNESDNQQVETRNVLVLGGELLIRADVPDRSDLCTCRLPPYWPSGVPG